MGRDEMRAADADRQQVADRLRLALDEGRLDLFEYDERLQRAYSAKTYGDLDGLLADLPTVAPVQRSQLAPLTDGDVAAADARYPDATRRWLMENWGGYAGVVAICVGIWLVTVIGSRGLVYFWPVWVIGPWGAILVWQTISGLVSGEPQRWAAEQQEKAVERQEKKAALREKKAAQGRRELRQRDAGDAGGQTTGADGGAALDEKA